MSEQIMLAIKPNSSLVKRREDETLPANGIRTEFMRDRDRILYSEPFRRLAGKTQVYSVGNSDHMRTRLTHTLEVSQIARTIAAALNLNCDLTEAIALGHDIGHTPFGHVGERTLHSIMTPHSGHYIEGCPFDTQPMLYEEHYGFKHNLHSVKVAYSSGLNLTNYTLYGIQVHSKLKYSKEHSDFFELGFYQKYQEQLKTPDGNDAWSLEAYVVAMADEIAQRHHDLEDAILGKIITQNEVNSIIKKYFENLPHELANPLDNKTYIKKLSSFIVNHLVEQLIQSSKRKILNFQGEGATEDDCQKLLAKSFSRTQLSDLISYDQEFKEKEKKFAKEISTRVLSSYDIQISDAKGAYIVRKLFKALYDTPQQLPDNSIISYLLRTGKYNENGGITHLNELCQKRGIGYIRKEFGEQYKSNNPSDNILLMRVICDHIAGMTDRYAIKTYRNLYGMLYE